MLLRFFFLAKVGSKAEGAGEGQKFLVDKRR